MKKSLKTVEKTSIRAFLENIFSYHTRILNFSILLLQKKFIVKHICIQNNLANHNLRKLQTYYGSNISLGILLYATILL